MTPELIEALAKAVALYGLGPIAGLMILFFLGNALVNRSLVCPRCGGVKKP